MSLSPLFFRPLSAKRASGPLLLAAALALPPHGGLAAPKHAAKKAAPRRITLRVILPSSEGASQVWKYTFKPPAKGWYKPAFSETGWKTGKAGFGTNPPGRGLLGTPWKGKNIWLRRTFNPGPVTPAQAARMVLRDFHDEDIQVFINGVPAYSAKGFITAYEFRPLSPAARQSLRPNAANEIAVHCHQTVGGQYVDVGIYEGLAGK